MKYEQLQLKEYLSILGIALGGNSTCLGDLSGVALAKTEALAKADFETVTPVGE